MWPLGPAGRGAAAQPGPFCGGHRPEGSACCAQPVTGALVLGWPWLSARAQDGEGDRKVDVSGHRRQMCQDTGDEWPGGLRM